MAQANKRSQTTVDRLNESLEAAQKAATSLRDDIGAGGHDLLRDLERMISAARRDAAKLSNSVRGDLADLQKAIVRSSKGSQPHPSGRNPSTRPKSARRPAPRKPAARA